MSTLKLLMQRIKDHPEWQRSNESEEEYTKRMLAICQKKAETLTLRQRERDEFWNPEF